MTEIPPIQATGIGVVGAPASRAPQNGTGSVGLRAEDTLEISELAQALSNLESETDIRIDKVLAIREEIANGTYETDEKIDITIERLLAALRGA